LQLFLDIFTGITLPILLLVAVGYGVQRRYSFDVPTLTRMQVYVLLPGALVYFPTAAKLPFATIWPIVWLSLLHFAFMFALGWMVAKAFGMSRNQTGLVALAALFSNSGNYGIPLIQLTFPEDYLLYQSVILAMHSVLIVPLTLLAMERKGEERPNMWRTLFGTPLLPAAALGYILKGFDVTLPTVLVVPLKLISEAFTPMALLLLGVQLATIKARVERGPLVLAGVLRMLIAPATVWAFAAMFGFPPLLIGFFVVSTAVPAAALISIFAHEFNTEPALASMIVFLSTVVSALTVTGWVYAVRIAGLQ
jgi:malate permease and related proteins